MRIAATAMIIALGGVAGAGEHGGRIVRVEHTGRHEVFVPSGTFEMGVDPTDLRDSDDPKQALSVVQQCRAAFEPRNPSAQTATSFCDGYRRELEEMTPRKATLRAFAIDRDEVTVADYRSCISAGACDLDPMIAGDERYIRDSWPVVNVTWFEAQDYCRYRGGRLPTEAEWERAARGDDGRMWPWGKVERNVDFNHGKERSMAMRDIDRGANQFMGDPDDADGFVVLAAPGSFPWGEGPYGTRDQAGNVAEWTADVWGSTEATLGYSNLAGCRVSEDDVRCIDPHRDGGGSEPRVVRGGSWRQPAFLGRADLRDPFNFIYDPTQRFSHIGFRCARTLSER